MSECLVTTVQASGAAGGIVPVMVSLANDTSTLYRFLPREVSAVDEAGSRFASVDPEEAAHRMSAGTQFGAASVAAVFGGVLAGLMGAPYSSGFQPSIRATIATFAGINSFHYGQVEALGDATTELKGLSLPAVDLYKGSTVSGYVYFDRRLYKAIEVRLADLDKREIEVVRLPWPHGTDQSCPSSARPQAVRTTANR